MNKESIIKALNELRKSKKRNFPQTVDLIITLKDVNLKNPSDNLDFYIPLPAKILKTKKICAFAGTELVESAKQSCDKVISQPDFNKFDKKAIKKLAEDFDYFIAQANIMGKVAGAFGRVLGPRGKMPNPKAGCVVPPKAALGPLYNRLQSTIKISAKKFPVIQLKVGSEEMSDEELAKNIVYFYDQIEHHLPKERHNIKGALIKLTMGKPLKI